MKKNRTLLYAAGAAIIALLALVLYVLSSSDVKDDDQPYMESRDDPSAPGGGGEDAALGFPSVDPVERLERYRQWAQYPPWTRPLSAGQVDLLEPYNGNRPAVGVIAQPASDCTNGPDGVRTCATPAKFSESACQLNPESSISVGREDFRVYLSCTNARGEKAAVDSLQVRVYRELLGVTTPTLPPVYIGDDGSGGDATANDKVYTITVRPTQQDWGDLFVEIDAQVSGFRHNQRTSWFSTPQTVGEFVSGVRDNLVNGNLVFYVPVRINKKGYYEFEANLQEAEGDQRFVASAYFEAELEPGAHTIELTYFGKVLADQGVDGPYVLRELRGRRDNSPISPAEVLRARTEGRSVTATHTEPMWEYMRPAANFTSQPYRADQFSAREWDSDEKRRRLELLEASIR